MYCLQHLRNTHGINSCEGWDFALFKQAPHLFFFLCSTRNLAFAWTLAFACYGHHLGHFLHALGVHEYAHTGFMSVLGNPVVSGVIGAAAMLGPGRQLLVDGALSLFRCDR